MKKFTTAIVLGASIFLSLLLLKGSDKFIYKFLSEAYLLHLFALLVMALIFVNLIFQDKTRISHPSPELAIFLVWVIYLVLYTIIHPNSEYYYFTYLLVAILIILSLAYLITVGSLKPQHLYISVALLGVAQSVVVILQSVHLLPSHSTDFTITGTLENPNITAMLICLSIPSWIEITLRVKRSYKFLLTFVWLLITIALVLLQCRTALIGIAVITSIYMVSYVKKKTGDISNLTKIMFSVILVALITTFIVLQQKKKASADGRMTIWKVSAEMIAKKPMTGHGYGVFQREYNLQQANYFNRSLRPEQEQMNAGFTAMAYNEYLEQTVMGGLPGGILFTAMILSLLWSGWKTRQTTVAAFAGIAAFATMSLFNFTIESPILLYGFAIYTSVLLTQNRTSSFKNSFIIPKKVASISVFIMIIFIVMSIQKYEAQKKLTLAIKLLDNGQLKSAGEILTNIEPEISTSEAFYRTKANYLIASKDFRKAQNYIVKALEFTSSPKLILIAAQLSERNGNLLEAEQYYKLVCGIEPHLLRPSVMLMQMHQRNGQNEKAKTIAKVIINMKPKFNNEQARKYKQIARIVITSSSTTSAKN